MSHTAPLNLRELFDRHDSDKGRKHSYEKIYEPYFEKLRDKPIALLEIGMYRGASMRCWCDYFCHGRIFGIDIRPHFLTPENQTFLQSEPQVQFKFTDSKDGNPFPEEQYDVIIDDGDHNLDTQRLTFSVLEKYLKPTGIYFIEDVRKNCSYRQPDGSLVENTQAKYSSLVAEVEGRGYSIEVGDSSCEYSDGSTCHILACMHQA
jgi:hypothetical protein